MHSGFSNVKEAKKKIPSDTSIIFERKKKASKYEVRSFQLSVRSGCGL